MNVGFVHETVLQLIHSGFCIKYLLTVPVSEKQLTGKAHKC